MNVESQHLGEMIRGELEALSDRRISEHIRRLLVEPRLEMRAWDYGAAGLMYPCWIVLEHRASNTGIAFCDQGFGPGQPWGLLFLTGEHQSMGMDSGWFSLFLDAYFGSQAPAELAIWRVFRRARGQFPGEAISGEAEWDTTWATVKQLRREQPEHEFDCWQSIYTPT